MTRYHFDNQVEKKKISRRKVVAMFFATVIIVIVIVFGIAMLVRNIARGPEWLRSATDSAGQQVVGTFTPKSVLLAENADLKDQIQKYQVQLIDFKTTQDENTALRTELSYVQHPATVIVASVLAKPSQSLYNSLVIDRGSNDGVVVGDLVTAEGTIGLGKIASVTPNTATVELFSGPQFSGDMVMKSQNITVPAIGKGGGNFEIHIPHEINVASGDILAFPGSPDIAVGVVESVIFDARDPFQTILARTPVNIQELRFVEVVK